MESFNQEAEVVVSRDHAIVLQPGQQSKILSQKEGAGGGGERKKILVSFKTVLDETVKIINFIKF